MAILQITPIWQIPQKHLIIAIKLTSALILSHKILYFWGIYERSARRTGHSWAGLHPGTGHTDPTLLHTQTSWIQQTPCGYEFSAQHFLHNHDLILPLHSLNHRHFARKSQSMDVTFHPLGRFPLCAHLLTQRHDLPVFPTFSGSLCPVQERLHQNPKSHTPTTLANDSTIGFILRKCGKGKKSQPMAPQPCHWPATFSFPFPIPKHRDGTRVSSGKAEPFPQNQTSHL